MSEPRKTLALWALCSGALMVVLDTTIVAVALPSMAADLKISEGSLTWLVNAYTVPFAGFLILGGRLGDLYGARRIFIGGILLFSFGSLVCGLAREEDLLLGGRAMQGLAAAIVMAISLVLLMEVFPGTAERARALSLYGLVCSAGGAVGELLGGFLTQALNWHWIFFVNVPVGACVWPMCVRAIPVDQSSGEASARLDFWGAATITTAVGASIYALTSANAGPGGVWRTAWSCGVSVVAVALFLFAERVAPDPMVPLRLFRLRNFAAANVLGVCWAVGASAWLIIMALYLQRILRYDPLQVGLAFLPAQLVMAITSVAGSTRIISRFGIRKPLFAGLLLAAGGLLLFSRVPDHGSFFRDVFPGTVLLGLGGGIASTPLLMAAMDGVERSRMGVASGVVNTAFMIGSALGLTLLLMLAEARASQLKTEGVTVLAALTGGYHTAFAVAAGFAAAAALLAALTLQPGVSSHPASGQRTEITTDKCGGASLPASCSATESNSG